MVESPIDSAGRLGASSAILLRAAAAAWAQREEAMTQQGLSDTIEVTTNDVACDGGSGALGHPRVWLHIKPETRDVVCPYCSRHYVLTPGVTATAAIVQH